MEEFCYQKQNNMKKEKHKECNSEVTTSYDTLTEVRKGEISKTLGYFLAKSIKEAISQPILDLER